MASGPRSTEVLKMHLLTVVLAHNKGPLGCTLLRGQICHVIGLKY